MGAGKECQLAGIEKQLEKVRKKLALLETAIGAVSHKQEVEAQRVSNLNKARIKEEKRKEAKARKIKVMKRQAE